MSEDCIFCKIVNGEIPSTVVYEDDHVLAFNDIDPQAPVHVVIIPKEHYESICLYRRGMTSSAISILSPTVWYLNWESRTAVSDW